MLIDMHAHCSEISRCCKASLEQAMEITLENGMDGFVLTNHYQKKYVTDGDYLAFAKRYMAECERAVAYGAQKGVPVFWGIEVTAEQYPQVHMLIYGVDSEFLFRYPTLFDYSQQELYRIVSENGGVLIQAHPYRGGTMVLDTAFLDGVEVNCHPLYGHSYCDELIKLARENDLIVTCGGDFHKDTYRPKCGIYLPDSIGDSAALGAYLKNAKTLELCIMEIETREVENILYSRKD